MNEDDYELGALIEQTHCLLRGQHGDGWDARAVNCAKYAHGDTPAQAMRNAIALRNGGQHDEAPRRRRAVFS